MENLLFFTVYRAGGGLTVATLFLCHPFRLVIGEHRVLPVRVRPVQLRFSLLLTQLSSVRVLSHHARFKCSCKLPCWRHVRTRASVKCESLLKIVHSGETKVIVLQHLKYNFGDQLLWSMMIGAALLFFLEQSISLFRWHIDKLLRFTTCRIDPWNTPSTEPEEDEEAGEEEASLPAVAPSFMICCWSHAASTGRHAEM